ncbi:MAG: hypothetical protein V2A79_02790 [Planctomycetota bacterium]
MNETAKKIGAIALALLTLGILVRVVWQGLAAQESPNDTRTLMDSETGDVFPVTIEELKPYPMPNPKTGKNTLYRTEVCYWGEECRKRGGTHVIMNTLMGKPEPTHCPVCGHVVRFHNPLPPDYNPSGVVEKEE